MLILFHTSPHFSLGTGNNVKIYSGDYFSLYTACKSSVHEHRFPAYLRQTLRDQELSGQQPINGISLLHEKRLASTSVLPHRPTPRERA